MKAVSVFVSLTLCVAAGTTAPSCKSASGSDVDFAYSFKYPKTFEYAYMDTDTPLTKASGSLTDDGSSISATIMQKGSPDVSYLIWNDEPTTRSSSSAPFAHSKGLLIFTSSGGVWITHSHPKFPVPSASSASDLWADAAEEYGQSYLCITITAEEIHKLVPVFKITRPTIYASTFASGDESTFADLEGLTHKGGWDEDTMTTQVAISSKGGQEFNVYAKAGAWGEGKDLYRDLVAPSIGKLDMEGWINGGGVWGPACGQDGVLDVQSVSFPGPRDWSTHTDHSKWAVAADKSSSSFCVGDLNRADGQDKRGGKTVCIVEGRSLRNDFADQMRKVISTTDSCDRTVMV